MEFLTGDPRPEIIPVLLDEGSELHVPALCDAELVNGLRNGTLRGRIPVVLAQQAIADYIDLPLVRHGHLELLARSFQLRRNFSAYDAIYVALAERLDAALLTADERLARAVRAHTEVALAT